MKLRTISFVLMATLLGSCATEPRPAGVSRFIALSAAPVYPNSFEVTAWGRRGLDVRELKEAWRKKADLVAAGKKYKSSPLRVRETEDASGGWPVQGLSVSGTITLIR